MAATLTQPQYVEPATVGPYGTLYHWTYVDQTHPTLCPKLILNPKLAESSLPITYCPVAQSLWNFAQSTAVTWNATSINWGKWTVGLYALCVAGRRLRLVFIYMMTLSNGNIFRVTGHLCGEFTGPRWIPRTKASDAELWSFLWSASE